MTIRSEERLASLIATGGVIWTVQVVTNHFTGLGDILLPQDPLEVCAVGVLIWLHAKWRRSVAFK